MTIINNVLESLASKNIIKSNISNKLLSKYGHVVYNHPFITLSRDAGSGGRLIAKKLAAKLKYDFYDDKLLDEIAHITKTKKYFLKAVDEKKHNLFKDLIQSVINVNYVDPYVYQESLVKVIVERAKKGRVVFLGRGANFITPRDKGLHVRVMAPFYTRVQNTIKFELFKPKQAIELVSKLDYHRSQFVKSVFGRDIRRAKYYDLILNTAMISIDSAVVIILKAFKEKFKAVKT